MRRQLIFSFASQALLGFAGLIFVSAFVSAYGKEQYALFSIFLAVASSVQNLDGLQMPLVARLSRCIDNREELMQLMQSATLFSTVIGFIGAVVAAIALAIALPDHSRHWSLWFVFIGVGIFVILHFARSAHRAYLIAKERSSVIHTARAFSYIALFICAFLIMGITRDIVMASMALAVAAFINSIIVTRAIHQPIAATWNFTGAFSSHGKDFLAGLLFNGSVFLFLIIDKLVIGRKGAYAAADYMIPYELFQRLSLIHTVIGTVLLGRAVVSFNKKNEIVATDKYSILCIDTIFFVSIVFLTMVMYGPDLLEIWLKDAVTPSLLSVYYILATAFFLNSFGWLGFNILTAQDQFHLVSKIYIGLPIILLLGCIWWEPKYGVIGVASAVAVARMVDVVLFILGNKIGGISAIHYVSAFRKIGLRWLLSIITIISIWLWINNRTFTPSVRLVFGVTAALTVLLCYARKASTGERSDLMKV